MNVLELPYGTEEDDAILRDTTAQGIIQVWHKKGFDKYCYHRVRGPAVIFKDGREAWYMNGDYYEPTAHECMLWELRKKNEFT